MNGIFIALVLSAVLYAAFAGSMEAVTRDGMIESAKFAVQTAIGLLGMMALWLGLMRVLQDAGLMRSIARALAPLMRRLFPEIPAEHPALSAMIMNISANILGLGNAATPFGLKAMKELNSLNSQPGVATNSMVLFLAINTSGVAVLPLGVIAIRSALGAEDPGGIFLPSVLATMCSTIVGVAVAMSLQRFFPVAAVALPDTAARESIADAVPEAPDVPEAKAAPGWRRIPLLLFVPAFALAMVLYARSAEGDGLEVTRHILSFWLLPGLMAGIVLYGFRQGVKVYESVIQGAREAWDIFVMIIPFLVTILVGVGMLRASGALDWFIGILQPLTSLVGFPAEALPMALIRPLSGSGAMGVMTETMQTYGPDSFAGYLVSVVNGSTETTFYVLAVYLGSVHIRAVRHAIPACLAADVTGVAAALLWCHLFF